MHWVVNYAAIPGQDSLLHVKATQIWLQAQLDQASEGCHQDCPSPGSALLPSIGSLLRPAIPSGSWGGHQQLRPSSHQISRNRGPMCVTSGHMPIPRPLAVVRVWKALSGSLGLCPWQQGGRASQPHGGIEGCLLLSKGTAVSRRESSCGAGRNHREVAAGMK